MWHWEASGKYRRAQSVNHVDARLNWDAQENGTYEWYQPTWYWEVLEVGEDNW